MNARCPVPEAMRNDDQGGDDPAPHDSRARRIPRRHGVSLQPRGHARRCATAARVFRATSWPAMESSV